MLTCISSTRARTKCVSAYWALSVLRHFTCEFLYKVALLKCWRAFRLRGLTQSVCLRSGLILVCGILPVNFCIKWLLWNLDMRFDCAGSHKMCVCVPSTEHRALTLTVRTPQCGHTVWGTTIGKENKKDRNAYEIKRKWFWLDRFIKY